MTDRQSSSSTRLLGFYLAKERDHKRRWIDQIWEWDFDRLEETHDYIQLLFPLKEKSGFNPTAPTLTDDVIQAFRAREDLRERMLRSLDVMLAFYGLRRSKKDTPEIVTLDDFENRMDLWVRNSNHNHLRLARIITSLRLLGLERYAKALFDCLDDIYNNEPGRLSPESIRHWKNAFGD